MDEALTGWTLVWLYGWREALNLTAQSLAFALIIAAVAIVLIWRA